jgi:hypothetical protein
MRHVAALAEDDHGAPVALLQRVQPHVRLVDGVLLAHAEGEVQDHLRLDLAQDPVDLRQDRVAAGPGRVDLTTVLAEKIVQSALGMKPAPIAVRKAVEVEPNVLKSYAGTYMLSPFFAITITHEDGKLMAQATGQDKFQLFPESKTKFFYKVVDAQITFAKDEEGKINKLVLHQSGQDVPGMKMPENK